jgi:thioredoxin 1
MSRDYVTQEPSRDAVEVTPGLVLLEFGAPWCGHCKAAQPLLEQLLQGRDDVRHIKVEDGRGRRLGRSFAVKLWPTLVLLRDGVEQARAVRPSALQDLAGLLPPAA